MTKTLASSNFQVIFSFQNIRIFMMDCFVIFADIMSEMVPILGT